MNLTSQLQNFNIVKTPFCDLIQNGTMYEMRAYKRESKLAWDVIESHSLTVSVTDNDRLAAHWAGFVQGANK